MSDSDWPPTEPLFRIEAWNGEPPPPTGFMKLMDLLPDLPAVAPPDLLVTSVEQDSRRVVPGSVFLALRGLVADGLDHVAEARSRGAVAVVSDRPRPPGFDLPWIVVPEPRRRLGEMASRFHGDPCDHLVLAGVTGTNGKTTTAMLLEAVLARATGSSGLLGTVEYRYPGRREEADRTTPDAPTLQRWLGEMVRAGVRSAAMEVSSHALALDRLAGCRFDVAVFLNLTRDHLDFHRDFEDYYEAKRRLFGLLKPGGTTVVNVDDSYGCRLASELAGARVITFSPTGRPADFRAENIRCDLESTAFDAVSSRGETARIRSPLPGRFNVENLLAALAAGVAIGMTPEAAGGAVASVGAVPGRMERVEAGQSFAILVDYAHTEDALRRLLLAVRELTQKKIILVFGCGGDRDRGKREPMGRVAAELADIPVATSDNPRSEDPEAILADVERGLQAGGATKYLKIVDRRQAIKTAIELANSGTVVILAGKGHERTQVIGREALPFDDRRVAAELARAAAGRTPH